MSRVAGLILCLLLLAAGAGAEVPAVLCTGRVTKDMTIRETRSTSAKKLGEVHRDETVSLVSYDEKWSEVTTPDARGFILSKNVTDLAAAGGYDDAAQAEYTGVAAGELSVRQKKDRESNLIGRVEEGGTVYVTALEGRWLEIVCRGMRGYVRTEQVRALAPAREGVALPEEYETPPLFRPVYTAQADLNLTIRRKPDADARALGMVDEDERVEVMSVEGAWAYVRGRKAEGYVLSGHLVHYRRADPFGPAIPGAAAVSCAATLGQSAALYDGATGEWLFTAPAGAVVAVSEPQADGSVPLPYHRTQARLADASALSLERTVPWEQALPGELLSVFSTYYDPAPTSEIQQGRIFNIAEGVRRIDGAAVAPEETFSFNALCAPYTKGNGWELGPIINYVSSQKTGYSGGVCQVSTTLYNAALRMPFEIVRQQPHSSYGVFYAPVDLDAAVGAGNLDLRLRNVLPYAVRISARAEGGVVTVAIRRADP